MKTTNYQNISIMLMVVILIITSLQNGRIKNIGDALSGAVEIQK